MKQLWRDNGLTLVLMAIFLASLAGQALTGWYVRAEELRDHGHAAPTFASYLASGHFLSALFENWESEFLQMAGYVLLTAFLVQKGSPESRKPDGRNPEDVMPRSPKADAPWPVRRGGLLLWIYSHSLGFALTGLFVGSFIAHLLGSHRRANEEALLHARPLKSLGETLGGAEFWYESFQNWQSEFLSIAVLLVLSVYLRERGSPESKPVAAPHGKTGH